MKNFKAIFSTCSNSSNLFLYSKSPSKYILCLLNSLFNIFLILFTSLSLVLVSSGYCFLLILIYSQHPFLYCFSKLIKSVFAQFFSIQSLNINNLFDSLTEKDSQKIRYKKSLYVYMSKFFFLIRN